MVNLIKSQDAGENTTVNIKQACTGTYFQSLTADAEVKLGETPVTYSISTTALYDGETKTTFSGAFFFINNNNFLHNNAGNTKYPIGAALQWAGGNSQWQIYKVNVEEAANTLRYAIYNQDETLVLLSELYAANVGEQITTLPSELQRPFCSYDVTETTIQKGENTVNVKVTYDLPFKTDGTAYYATLRDHYVYYDADNNDVRTNQTGERNDAYKWVFSGNPYDGFKVKNVATGKYLNNTPTTVQLAEEADAFAWAIDRLNDTYTFGLKSGANYINEQNHTNHNLIYYTVFTTDPGSQWKVAPELFDVTYKVKGYEDIATATATNILEGSAPKAPDALKFAFTTYTYDTDIIDAEHTTIIATPHFNMPFEVSENYDNAKWYCLKGHSTVNYGRYICTNGENILWSKTIGENGAAYYWAFIGDPINGIKLINKATGEGKYLSATDPITMGTEKIWTLKEQTDSRYIGESINGFGLYDTGRATYANAQDHAEYGSTLTYWGGFDNGSTLWTIAYEDIVSPLQGKSFGDGLSQYAIGEEFSDYSIEDITTNRDYVNIAIKLINSGITLNMPKDKTFLRIKGKNSGKYMSNGTAAGSRYTMTTDADATTIFYYADGKLLNYNNGLYNATNSENWGWAIGQDNASTVTFADGNTSGGYAISTGEATTFFYDHGTQNNYVDRGRNMENITGHNDLNYRSWILEEVTELPLTLSYIDGKYYSTLNLPVDVTISGANAYAPTLSENNTIICDKAIYEVPAETPVILISDDNANAVAKIGTVSSTATSVLSGTLGKTPNTGNNVYVLSYDDNDVVAFYKYEGENIPGFKAYFAPEDGAISSAKFAISFADDDDITAVEAVEAAASSAENAAYYDLQGRRVAAPQAGQLYIINGKKVVY